jgi:starvation-inducible DNA-binding protein
MIARCGHAPPGIDRVAGAVETGEPDRDRAGSDPAARLGSAKEGAVAINIGLPQQHRQGVVGILSKLLADEYLLYTKTRNYHWNVVGPQFNDLHKFFEAQYEAIDEFIDEVAERARTLGGHAVGTLAEFKQLARLKEQPGRRPAARQMLQDLLVDHEALIQILRRDLETAMDKHGDAGTSDFRTGRMERHEKMAWMLRSFLEGR